MVNMIGFRRDALLLIESIRGGELSEAEIDYEGRELAKDYNIGSASVWDKLANLEAEHYDCLAEVSA
ncbi:MAG TPA: hypothetical protein VM537_29025 [Anaerolineae bacterium]|nr:hypothetical protein [Anaerolineae bacterium]